MPQCSDNTHRLDPYKNFNFRIKWDGKYVAGINKISALKCSTESVTHLEGGDPGTSRVSPSTGKFEPITLERGVTHDHDFEKWANLIHQTDGDAAISPENFRKDLIIEMLNEQGNVTLAYKVYRCWVSEYRSLPELDANANAIETLVLQNEGWERHVEGTEPTES